MIYKTRREIHNQPIHSEACNALRFQAIKERGEYFEKWPDHCQDCDGHGGISGSGSSMRPSSLQSQYAIECGVCLMHAKCPRCAAALPKMRVYDADLNQYFGQHIEMSPCHRCGWNWGKNEGDAPPLIPSCTEDCMFYGRI